MQKITLDTFQWGDWEAVYLDGNLVAQHHKVERDRILLALRRRLAEFGIHLYFTSQEYPLPDGALFPATLDELGR